MMKSLGIILLTILAHLEYSYGADDLMSEKAKKKFEDITKDCGSTMGCAGIPKDCINNSSCRMFASWKHKGSEFKFQIVGNLPKDTVDLGHVSFGLSLDQTMGQDLVVGCVFQNGKVLPKTYYNYVSGKQNSAFPNEPAIGLISREGKKVDNTIFCKYKMAENFTSPGNELGREFNFSSDEYYLLFARSNLLKSNDETRQEKLGYHGEETAISSEPVKLTSTNVVPVEGRSDQPDPNKSGSANTVSISIYGILSLMLLFFAANQ